MLVSKSDIKRNCLFAYLHMLLVQSEIQTLSGKGQKAVEDEDKDDLKRAGYSLVQHWESKHWTSKDVKRMATRFRFVPRYYNSVTRSVVKHFPVGEEIIPLYLALIIVKKYQDNNFKVAPENIKLEKLIPAYEKSKHIDKRTKFNYYKIAREIIEGLAHVK